MTAKNEVQRRARVSVSNDLFSGICALLAVRLGPMNFGLSLPHAANGCFRARISRGEVAGRGWPPPGRGPPRTHPPPPIYGGAARQRCRGLGDNYGVAGGAPHTYLAP